MEWGELIRQTLRNQVIPAVVKEGVRALHLPRDFGPHDCLAPGRWGPRENRHPEPDLGCFLSGVSRVWVDDHLIAFHAGDILLLPPNVKHSYATGGPFTPISAPTLALQERPTALWTGMFPFGVTIQFFQMVGDTACASPWCVLSDRRILEAAQSLLEELECQREDSGIVVQGFMLEILGRLCRASALLGLEFPLSQDGSPPETAASDLDAAVTTYILHHYDQPLALNDIARDMFMSSSRLSHQFKQHTGQTVMERLTETRIAAAKRLLRTSLPIARVASLVGFSNPYYFSRVFRTVVGESPRQFRAHQSEGASTDKDG